MRSFLLLLSVLFCSSFLYAQTSSIDGRIVDGDDAPIRGVHVRLTFPADTVTRYITTTYLDGTFNLPHVEYHSYELEISYVGFQKIERRLVVNSSRVDLGTLTLLQTAIPLREVVAEGRIPPAVQKGDTTEYVAKAFKTNPDAVAEDLLTKMPGITVDGTTVKAKGEEVQRVLIDGRAYFGDDPTVALKNLPAEVIEKIQVFDQKSDQSQFSGFDDGQSVRTLNIVTRQRGKNMRFGKFSAGAGENELYLLGFSYNYFNNATRLSFLGSSNNLNQQGFTGQDILGIPSFQGTRGGMGGPGGGGPGGGGSGGGQSDFSVGQQGGLNKTHSIGSNYADSLGDDGAFHASYFGDRIDNTNTQTVHREYFSSGSEGNQYDETSNSTGKNFNHRINSKIDWSLDAANSIVVTPVISFQSNRTSKAVDAVSTTAGGSLLGSTSTLNDASLFGHNVSANVLLRHRFLTLGRTLSLNVAISENRKNSDAITRSTTSYASTLLGESDTLNQRAQELTKGYSVSTSLMYTEPVGEKSQLQINYSPSYSKNSSDKRTYDFNRDLDGYMDFNTSLSNAYEDEYTTQNTGIGWHYGDKKTRLSASVAYQSAVLNGSQTYPTETSIRRKYEDVLPDAMLMFNLSSNTNIHVMYRASTKAPGISQLQDVVDNTNPLLLTSGNPNLKETYTHSLLVRFGTTAAQKGRSFFMFMNGTYSRNYIGKSVLLASADTVLPSGLELASGTQLTTPANFDGYYSGQVFMTFGFPFDLVSSTLNTNLGYNYSRTPGSYNGVTSLSNISAANAGFALGSNISEDVDFTLSYNGTYNYTRNSQRSSQNTKYYMQTVGVRFVWTMFSSLVLRNDLSSTAYAGVTNSSQQGTVLWATSLAKKFLENNAGELRLTVNDVLGQNKSYQRTTTESYVEDQHNTTLTRYVLLTFLYTIR